MLAGVSDSTLIAGWVVGKIMKGGGYGVLADILLGIVALLVVGLFGFGPGGMIWSTQVAILGAVILIWITRLIKKEAQISERSRFFGITSSLNSWA